MSPYLQSDLLAIQLARRYANKFGMPFFAVAGMFEGYDVASIDLQTRIEVKCDYAAQKTGNVAVEYWNTCLNKPSGILATSATLWLHLIPAGDHLRAFEYDIPTLRKLVIETGAVTSNGSNSLCKIINIPTFTAAAKDVYTIDLNVGQVSTIDLGDIQHNTKERK